MTTHGILALATANGWEGGTVYADAAPSRFGPAFWRDLHGPFGGDRYAWAYARVVAHPAGWVRYPTVCACHGTTPPRGHGSGALHRRVLKLVNN
jgi:hypothetical protein